MVEKVKSGDSLFDLLLRVTGQVAEGTFDLARNTAAMTAMFGENWLRSMLLNRLEPERLEAMAEAGHFLRDARETAGISIKELSEMLGLQDRSVLEDIEGGRTIMPLELLLRATSLLARHDPIPFLIKFMRTYNPALEQTLEQLGVMALPRQYERERRFVNLVRQHDSLRTLTDEEYQRFIRYMDSSCTLVLEVMHKEKQASATARRGTREASTSPRRKRGTSAGTGATRRGGTPGKRASTSRPRDRS